MRSKLINIKNFRMINCKKVFFVLSKGGRREGEEEVSLQTPDPPFPGDSVTNMKF